MRSCHFDPAQLDSGDFARSAILAPASIQRSVVKRQAEFLAGRICAREALHHLTGTASIPELGEDRAPIWPAGICGSISHSHGLASALVARHGHWRGLGLDLETPLCASRAERLAKEILTPAEQQRMGQLDPIQQAERVTLTFSIKESLFKALYPLVGQRFYFHDAELLVSNAEGQVQLRLLRDLTNEWHSGRELDGHYCYYRERLLSLVAIPA
jgi:enterobactin synthetase component D